MRPVRFAAFALTLLVMACATGSGSSDGGPRRNPNLISAQELGDLSGITGFEAVQQLRPLWLNGRGGNRPVVFVDGSQQGMGSVETLREFGVEMIREIQFISAADATMRYGTGFQGGVINLISR